MIQSFRTLTVLAIAMALSATRLTAQDPALTPPIDITANMLGRLTSVGNVGTRTFYQYDKLGRATATQFVQDGNSRVIGTKYGYPQPAAVAGPGTVIVEQRLPDNEIVNIRYDAGGEQLAIDSTPPGGSLQNVVRDIRRNARGQTTSFTLGNGTATTKFYNDNSDLRVRQITSSRGGTPIQSYVYDYDFNGNVIALTDGVIPMLSRSYTYDELDQLKSIKNAAGNPLESYSYDPVGNLTVKGGLIQTYNAGGRPHALVSSGSVAYGYDPNGNVTSMSNGTTLTWNAENMSSRVATATTVTTKSFIGESMWKKEESANAVTTVTYYLPGMRIENRVYRKYYGSFAERSAEDGQLRYYHSDHLGSSTIMTNASGQVIRQMVYFPYGEDHEAAVNAFTPKLQFNFKERDANGFYDYGARIYNPGTGRWLSPDSDSTDGLNRYAYVSNNPVRYVDPTGHQQSQAEKIDAYNALSDEEKERIPQREKPGFESPVMPGVRVDGWDLARDSITLALMDFVIGGGRTGGGYNGRARIEGGGARPTLKTTKGGQGRAPKVAYVDGDGGEHYFLGNFKTGQSTQFAVQLPGKGPGRFTIERNAVVIRNLAKHAVANSATVVIHLDTPINQARPGSVYSASEIPQLVEMGFTVKGNTLVVPAGYTQTVTRDSVSGAFVVHIRKEKTEPEQNQ